MTTIQFETPATIDFVHGDAVSTLAVDTLPNHAHALLWSYGRRKINDTLNSRKKIARDAAKKYAVEHNEVWEESYWLDRHWNEQNVLDSILVDEFLTGQLASSGRGRTPGLSGSFKAYRNEWIRIIAKTYRKKTADLRALVADCQDIEDLYETLASDEATRSALWDAHHAAIEALLRVRNETANAAPGLNLAI